MDKQEENQMAKLSKANRTLLGSIVAAMAVEATPYAMLTVAEIAALTKEGLVEFNPDISDGDKFAVRATDKGIAVNAETTDTPTATAAAVVSSFVTGTGFVPPASRGGKGRTKYDFDNMPVGGFIFVPNSEAKPNMAKSLASTVSSASKRAAPKKFGVASVEAGVQYGEFTAPANGAVIYREADLTPAA